LNWEEFKESFHNKSDSEKKDILNEIKQKLNNTNSRETAEDYGVYHTTLLNFVKNNGMIYDNEVKSWKLSDDIIKGDKAGEKQGEDKNKYETEDKGDYWIISDGKTSFPITKEKYRLIRKDYCDPKGRASNYLKIPEITRKHKISRKHFMMLKNAFGFIHDDIEYTDEEIEEHGVDSLVQDHLEKDKDEYFQKLEEKEIKKIIRENNKYRKKDYFLRKAHNLVTSHFVEFAEIYKPPKVETNQRFDEDGDYMLEVPIVDLHLNKLAWHPETGESYDTEIAEERFMYVIDDILSRERVMNKEYKKIIFPIGNDFFNFDDSKGRTTRGTMQRSDDRWQDMYLKGQELLIKAIDKLKQLAPVSVFLVPGNHDWVTSFHSIVNIKSWFRNDENVSVNTNPASRKYVRFGKNLIGFTHLDKESRRIYGCMQVEAKTDWGQTYFHEWHGAHIHSELAKEAKEDKGVIVRNLASVTGRDDWHFNKGYLSHPHSQAFIWHKDKGLRDTLNTEIIVGDELEECNNRITV